MNLSTAIRLGCETSRQTFTRFQYTRRHKDGSLTILACALGAAYLAVTGRPRKPEDLSILQTLCDTFPVLEQRVPGNYMPGCQCPIYPGATVKTLVTHWNDGHEWTRERIADVLDDLGLG